MRIEFPPDLPHALRSKDPAAESNGLLYGFRQGPEVRLLAARVWPDDRPAFLPHEETDPRLASLSAIGIFVCRRRGEVFLTEADLALFEKRQAQVALVIAGERAGFFIKEADGSFRTVSSYEEFPIAAAGSTPTAAGPTGRPPSGDQEVRPAGLGLRYTPPGRPWGWVAALTTVILGIPLAGMAVFAPRLPSSTIALAVAEREGQLLIEWNPRAISSGAQIEIADGAERTVLPLAVGQSSATYRVRDGDIEVSVSTSHGTEFARLVTRPAPAPEPAHARAEVARMEAELEQLRAAAEQGGARIVTLNSDIARLNGQRSALTESGASLDSKAPSAAAAAEQ